MESTTSLFHLNADTTATCRKLMQAIVSDMRALGSKMLHLIVSGSAHSQMC